MHQVTHRLQGQIQPLGGARDHRIHIQHTAVKIVPVRVAKKLMRQVCCLIKRVNVPGEGLPQQGGGLPSEQHRAEVKDDVHAWLLSVIQVFKVRRMGAASFGGSVRDSLTSGVPCHKAHCPMARDTART